MIKEIADHVLGWHAKFHKNSYINVGVIAPYLQFGQISM